MSPPSGSLTVKAQVSTSTATYTSYHIDDLVSTRGHFDYLATGELISGHNKTDYEYYTTNHKIQNQFICPAQKEIAIYIHGEWTDEAAANEQFDRIAKSITINNYSIPLIGFSWDANTPLNKSGWEIAKKIATNNGQKLAQFISDFKNKCKDVDIRLIAHSLAAAIVNSTLITISNNQMLNNDSNFNIKSVHLLGAAMDRSAAASNTTFGKSIGDIVDYFYNFRNPEDNMLEYIYRYLENRDAIGLLGIQ
ncbi:MAG TPA: alpha/beta hydrolase, partial [Nitrososphaeraceae archaeon]